MAAGYEKTARVHLKLLSFLKRTMPYAENRRLCPETCEPCMLAKEEKSSVGLKYVFITCNAVYEVDYKLKSEPKVLCSLEEIVGTKQTHTLPVFLSKEDGEKTVHVQITHANRQHSSSTDVDGKPSMLRSLSPSFVQKMLHSDLSSSTESVSSVEEGHLSSSSSPGSPFASQKLRKTRDTLKQVFSSLSSKTSPAPTSTCPSNASSDELWVGKKSDSFHLSPGNPAPPHHLLSPISSEGDYSSRTATPKSSLSICLGSSSPSTEQVGAGRRSLSPLCHSHSLGKTASLGELRDASQPGESGSLKSGGVGVAISVPGSKPTCRSHTLARRTNISLSSIRTNPSSSASLPRLDGKGGGQKKSQSMDFASFLDRGGGGRSHHPSSQSRPGSMLSLASSSLRGSSASLDSRAVVGEGSEVVVTDVFVLNVASNFHRYLELAREERLMALTFQQSPSAALPTSQIKSIDSLRLQYQRLQQELLMADSLEGVAELLAELLTASQRFTELKQFFWEDSSVFDFCVKLLETHLPATPHMSTRRPKVPIHRADQLELCSLAVELLYHQMCDISCSDQRAAHVRRDRGQTIEAVVNAVLALRSTSENHSQLSTAQKDEIARLGCEVVERSTCVLSQASRVVDHAHWTSGGKVGGVSLSWYASLVDQHRNGVNFLKEVVSRCSSLTKAKVLSSDETLVVYHSLNLLSTAGENSKNLLRVIQENFNEEIKYFFRVSVFSQIVPDECPLKPSLIRTVVLLRSLVLGP